MGSPMQLVDISHRGLKRLTDTLSRKERSERMARIGPKNSSPEMRLRRLVHRMGYRYRLHVGTLPGSPDLVFPSRKCVIFMHGCFWHRHPGCRLARLPKSRLDFWRTKLEANRSRDLQNQAALRKLGWRILIIWECQLADVDRVEVVVRDFLELEQGEAQ